MSSLRLRLLVIIGTSLLVLWSLVAAWMLVDLRSELRVALDDRLAASARMVASLVSRMPDSSAALNDRTEPLADIVGRDGLACEVSLLRGEVAIRTLARTAASPGLDDLAPGYGTRYFGGRLWRTYVLHEGSIRVATADRIDVRETLLRDVALAAGIPFAVALIGSLAMLWFGIGSGLAPLERMRKLLAQRRADESAPLPDACVPEELRPLADTIAHLLERVRGAIDRERRFTGDAAHELRTPLTGIKLHLQVLRLAVSARAVDAPVSEALAHADHGVLRMQRTLEQLLLLARLDGEVDAGGSSTSDAGRAARQAIHDAESVRAKRAKVMLQQTDHSIQVAAPDVLLASALRNLLDNALRSAPSASTVILRIEGIGPQWVRFTVLDEGPGMSHTECLQAVQRFWRRSNTGEGSGLGLSIVSTIARRCGGDFSLHPREGGGLRVELTLPAATPF